MSSPGPPVLPSWPADLPHDSLQVNIIIAAALTWLVSAVSVGLRFYTRGRVVRALNSSDWCILASLIISLGVTVEEIEEALRGAGRHLWDLDPNDTESGKAWARAGWVAILLYEISLGITKISILLLYLNIFTFHSVRRAGQVVLVVVIVTTLYMVVTTCTACIPLQSYWDPSIPKVYCNAQSIWWSHTGMLILTDVLIFLLPMPAVWQLNLPRRQKYVLFGIFSLGFFVVIISFIRLKFLIEIEIHPPQDFFYATADLSYWTLIEVNGAIVCASLMTLKPLISRFFPRFFTSSSNASNSKVPSDDWVSPPTIGSKPSPLESERRWRDEDEEDAIGLELDHVVTRTSRSLTGSEHDSPVRGTELRPPPEAHLHVLRTAAFLDSASDSTGPVRAEGSRSLRREGSQGRLFYDSASEKTDWGPEIREDSIR